jgi:hypothetical protein
MSRPALLRCAAAGLALAAGCARVTSAPEESTVLSSLFETTAVRQTLRAQAAVRVSGAGRGGSFAQVVVVELPDRARLEVQSMVGSTALVLVVRGDRLQYRSYLEHEYVTAPATRESLDRLAGIPLPPPALLRLLLGLTPLPLTRGDPRMVVEPEGPGFRLESVHGALWQRLWTGAGGLLERGELGQAGRPLFAFAFREYRPVDGLPFPFELAVEDAAGRTLTVRYESVKLNDAIPDDLFALPAPTDGRTRIRELQGAP